MREIFTKYITLKNYMKRNPCIGMDMSSAEMFFLSLLERYSQYELSMEILQKA